MRGSTIKLFFVQSNFCRPSTQIGVAWPLGLTENARNSAKYAEPFICDSAQPLRPFAMTERESGFTKKGQNLPLLLGENDLDRSCDELGFTSQLTRGVS